MAIRPVFYSSISQNLEPSAKEVYVEFPWHPGFSIAQKQRSINSLHTEILNKTSLRRPLEISTKSTVSLGVNLSAFNLQLRIASSTTLVASVETIYQASKIFDDKKRNDQDRFDLMPSEARKRARYLQSLHVLTGWSIDKYFFDLDSGTKFYDWLYLAALLQQPSLLELLNDYDCFTDIEFNSKKSRACQARSAALAKSADQLEGGILSLLRNMSMSTESEEFKSENTKEISRLDGSTNLVQLSLDI